MIYGLFDPNGLPAGFYSEDVYQTIPENAVQISDQDWQRYLTGGYYRDSDGVCTQIAVEVVLADLIAARQGSLNSDLNAYIYEVYDAGTQASMQALYSRSTTSETIKAQIEAVWEWIASIVSYYYQCKSRIGALTDAASVAAYTWDFAQFDATCPDVTLQAIFESL